MCEATQLTSIFSRNKKRETISIAEINKDNITITTKRENGLQFREIEKSMWIDMQILSSGFTVCGVLNLTKPLFLSPWWIVKTSVHPLSQYQDESNGKNFMEINFFSLDFYR